MSRLLVLSLFAVVLGAAGGSASDQAHVTKEPFANDGTPVQIDLPASLHMRNCGGSDGSGLCVFTSANHAAYWGNCEALFHFQDFMKKRPGGGWPEKLDKMVSACCLEQKKPRPILYQCECNDLEILKAGLASGRMACTTYSFSPTGRYGGAKISHMVNTVAAGVGKGPDGKGWYCVLDNNYPNSYEWMSESVYLRVSAGGGKIWQAYLLTPPPPPVPIQ